MSFLFTFIAKLLKRVVSIFYFCFTSIWLCLYHSWPLSPISLISHVSPKLTPSFQSFFLTSVSLDTCWLLPPFGNALFSASRKATLSSGSFAQLYSVCVACPTSSKVLQCWYSSKLGPTDLPFFPLCTFSQESTSVNSVTSFFKEDFPNRLWTIGEPQRSWIL